VQIRETTLITDRHPGMFFEWEKRSDSQEKKRRESQQRYDHWIGRSGLSISSLL